MGCHDNTHILMHINSNNNMVVRRYKCMPMMIMLDTALLYCCQLMNNRFPAYGRARLIWERYSEAEAERQRQRPTSTINGHNGHTSMICSTSCMCC